MRCYRAATRLINTSANETPIHALALRSTHRPIHCPPQVPRRHSPSRHRCIKRSVSRQNHPHISSPPHRSAHLLHTSPVPATMNNYEAGGSSGDSYRGGRTRLIEDARQFHRYGLLVPSDFRLPKNWRSAMAASPCRCSPTAGRPAATPSSSGGTG